MRNFVRRAFFLLLCGMIMAEASITCTCWQHKDNTFCSTVPHSNTCEDYSWKVNEKVVAHAEISDQTLVRDYGQWKITFTAVQTNVTYFCNKMTTIDCNNVSPTQPSGPGNLAQKGKTTLTPSTELPSPKDSPNLGIILGITIPAAFVLSILFLAWWKRDRLKCFQDRKAARCRPDDSTTRHFLNGGEPPV